MKYKAAQKQMVNDLQEILKEYNELYDWWIEHKKKLNERKKVRLKNK